MRDLFYRRIAKARAFLADCENALLFFAALAVPAAAGGYALFAALYRERIAALFLRASELAAGQGGVGTMLLCAAAPPLMFGAAMIASGASAYALPLWGLAALCYAGGLGMTAGFGGALWSADLRGASLLLCLCPAVVTAPLYLALAMLPIRSLQARGACGEEERFQRHVLKCLGHMTLLAALSTLLAALGGSYALGRLFD